MSIERPTYQDVLLGLEQFWAGHGCVIWQPYHTEVGAGTFNPATFLRAWGPTRGTSPTWSPPSGPPTAATARTPTGWATTTSTR